MKNINWFVKTRGSYLPKTWQAKVIYLIYLAYMVWILVYVIISHYDFWPAVFILIPNWIAAYLVISWLAIKKS